MAAHISGSILKTKSSNVDKKYVDSKFITMTRNLQLKINKAGDKMNGELDMCDNLIKNVSMPFDQFDAAPKEYIDQNDAVAFNKAKEYVDQKVLNLKQYMEEKIVNLYTLNTNGLVPHFINPINATGFVVSANSTLNNLHAAHKIFIPNNNSSWRVDGISTNFWIEIKCPYESCIYKFSIQPADNTKLIKWKIQGRNNGFHLWENLSFNIEPLIDNSIKVFTLENLKLAKSYYDYRIFIEEAEGENPGLNYWQLYAINPVFSQ
jgi:hypothetical protein